MPLPESIQQSIQQQLSIADALKRPDDGLRDALSQYRQQGVASDERLAAAQAEAGKDPRNIIGKLMPGILSLGGLIDMARGKPNVSEKLQRALATERGKTAEKRDTARQKLLDTIGLEDRKGRRRATELGVTGQIAGQEASRRNARLKAAGDISKAAKGETVSAKDQLAFKDAKIEQEILSRDPNTWSVADKYFLSKQNSNFEYQTADQINQEREESKNKYVDSVMKSIDTEGMGPQEVINVRNLIGEQFMKQFADVPAFEFGEAVDESRLVAVEGGAPAGSNLREIIDYFSKEKTGKQEELRKMLSDPRLLQQFDGRLPSDVTRIDSNFQR